MNQKANHHRREQNHLTHEVQQARIPVQTFEQKQEAADQLAKQIADHLAKGGSIQPVPAGATAITDGRNPVAPMNRAQQRARK
jgi:uncharacterized protein YoaH (UPF0181 family)